MFRGIDRAIPRPGRSKRQKMAAERAKAASPDKSQPYDSWRPLVHSPTRRRGNSPGTSSGQRQRQRDDERRRTDSPDRSSRRDHSRPRWNRSTSRQRMSDGRSDWASSRQEQSRSRRDRTPSRERISDWNNDYQDRSSPQRYMSPPRSRRSRRDRTHSPRSQSYRGSGRQHRSQSPLRYYRSQRDRTRSPRRQSYRQSSREHRNRSPSPNRHSYKPDTSERRRYQRTNDQYRVRTPPREAYPERSFNSYKPSSTTQRVQERSRSPGSYKPSAPQRREDHRSDHHHRVQTPSRDERRAPKLFKPKSVLQQDRRPHSSYAVKPPSPKCINVVEEHSVLYGHLPQNTSSAVPDAHTTGAVTEVEHEVSSLVPAQEPRVDDCPKNHLSKSLSHRTLPESASAPLGLSTEAGVSMEDPTGELSLPRLNTPSSPVASDAGGEEDANGSPKDGDWEPAPGIDYDEFDEYHQFGFVDNDPEMAEVPEPTNDRNQSETEPEGDAASNGRDGYSAADWAVIQAVVPGDPTPPRVRSQAT